MLEVGCQDGPGGSSDSGLTIGETRSHFGGWCIVSSPLTLSHDVNNETITDFVSFLNSNDRALDNPQFSRHTPLQIWPVISNPEAIAVNQEYYGFSGSSFSSGDGPVSPGEYVTAVACNSSDATQSGWAYDATKMTLTFGGQCVDASTQDQVLLVDCDGSTNQQFKYNAQHEFETVGIAGSCLDVWMGNGPPGGPAVQIYDCNGGQNQQLTLLNSVISTPDGLCIASRNAVPGTLSSFFKPMSWDKTKYAVLLINVASSPADLVVQFSDVPGLVGTSCDARDIWARVDLGTFQGSYNASNIGTHDSAFLMLTCS